MADLVDNDHTVRESEDTRFDDLEFNPQLEPRKSKAWLNLLKESEKAFEEWNERCDNIDKRYANITRLIERTRDKEFQMFWANIEVEKPTIYARPPVPVVVTKFKDRRPVPQAAAELLERTTSTAFDLMRVDALMKQVRDNLVMHGRGVAWVRYQGKRDDGGYYDFERVCVDFKQRKDFLHSLSPTWGETWWVAGASYLTREEARDRFKPYSDKAYQDAEYKVDKDSEELGGTDNRERAKFWEIWDRRHRRCIWVAEGVDVILDEDDAHEDFCEGYPCPPPAYGTCQPGSLVPVPDVLQYKDQLDELDLLTSKIHALSSALEAKGFYPAGGAEVGPAIEAALAQNTPGRLLVPISNWSAFGGSKEVIVWMPIAEIAQTIQSCVELRKQIIEDIYQIKGLSDIMRGSTDPGETLGAQQLKSQFGSTRTRDKSQELVRFAKDLVSLAADIICDRFDPVTIIEMSQTQLPTEAMQREQVMQIAQSLQQQQMQLQQMQMMAQQAAQMQLPPPGGPMMGAPPPPQQDESMQQALQQVQSTIQQGEDAIKKVMGKANFQQVMRFLRDNRSRAFVLDIETDSTILVDEQAEKQRRAEFTGMLAQLLPQITQMIMVEPKTANFCGEILKFSVAPYRAGRSLDGAIDDLVMLMEQKADMPKGDDPQTAAAKTQLQIEQMKDQTEQKKVKQDGEFKMAGLKQKDDLAKLKIQSSERIQFAKLRASAQDNEADAQQTNLEAMQSRQEHQQKMLEGEAKIRQQHQKIELDRQHAQFKQQDAQARADERRAMQQFKMMQPPAPSQRRPM